MRKLLVCFSLALSIWDGSAFAQTCPAWRSANTYALSQSVSCIASYTVCSSGFWISMKTYHDRMAGVVRDGAVLVIGDSHIQGMSASSIDSAAVNLGIGGDTMRGVINRMTSYEPLSRAGAVVLQIGTNDFLAEATNWSGNIPLLVDKMFAHFSGGPVVWALIPPIALANQTGVLTQANIDTINAAIADKAASYTNVTVVDIATPLKNGSGFLDAAYTFDGIHMNTLGQEIWIGLVRAALATY